MRSTGREPGLGRGRQIRSWPPYRPGDRKLRQRLLRRHDVDLVGDQPEAVTEVGEPEDDRGSRSGVEHEPDRIAPTADRQRMDLARRSIAGDRRTDLEHVGTEHGRQRLTQVVGVVLHERRAALEALAHDLEDADERGRLPITLGAETVALCHQPLRTDARQLFQPTEVLERVRERPVTAGREE